MSSYDALVIGGGLVGCATANYLAQAGLSVALIEKGNINQEASGRNAGSLHFQIEHRQIHHAQDLDSELQYCVSLAQLAIASWREIETELETNVDLAMDGGLMLAETGEEVSLLEKKAKLESEQGLNVQLMDGDETRRLAPYLGEHIKGALFCPDEGHCNPRLLTPAVARQAEKNGVTLFTRCHVTDIRRANKSWRVTAELNSNNTNHETMSFEGSIIVNAAGAWAVNVGRMANVHLPIFPVALLINVTEKVSPLIHHLIQHVGRKLSMKQVEDGNVLIGGGWSARLPQQRGDWLSDSAELDINAVRGNLQTATDIAPMIKQLRLLRTWTGTTGVTPDQLPIVGEVSQAPGFYVAAGGSGFTYGPTYARLLCEMITRGEPSFPLTPYSPDRFSHMNMFMG
ncbi:MAG: FAD-dependent oxidoreductase [Pseudomonadales bacterium]